MKECPACESATWHGSPIGYPHGKRCEVCKGIGLVSDQTIMQWELSL